MATRKKFDMDIFDETTESWNNYLERLEIAFQFNETSDSDKLITLLHTIGKSTNGVLRDLLQPKTYRKHI